jgi:hypothetical protein
MATVKHAEVTRVESLGSGVRLLELQSQEPLQFVGGQYVIIDSGLTLPNGKAAKRAYSIVSADAEQRRFQLAVKRIPEGPASGFLHELEPGTQLPFSGPWGKLFLEPPPEVEPTLIVATDTGITAALGLLQASRFAPFLPGTTLLWLEGEPNLPKPWVQIRLPANLGRFTTAPLPKVGHPERAAQAQFLVRAVAEQRPPQRALLTGDGALHAALQEVLQPLPLQLESFFNHPVRKSV